MWNDGFFFLSEESSKGVFELSWLLLSYESVMKGIRSPKISDYFDPEWESHVEPTSGGS